MKQKEVYETMDGVGFLVFWPQTIVQGDLYDHESLVKAIKEVDVVISTVGHDQLPDQCTLISAIKEVGHIKVIHIYIIWSFLFLISLFVYLWFF